MIHGILALVVRLELLDKSGGLWGNVLNLTPNVSYALLS